MTLQLNAPLIITSRLRPGIKIGEHSTISISVEDLLLSGRYIWRYWIDTPDFEYTQADMESRSCVVQEALKSLIGFLTAAAEAYRYEMNGRKSENGDLFGPRVMEWAYQNDTELQCALLDLEEPSQQSERL